MGRRGRPEGFRLSEESKRAISASKTGQRHRQETKDKISKSLTDYFRNLHPLSVELIESYSKYTVAASYTCWFSEFSKDIDGTEGVRTDRAMRNSRKMELSCGRGVNFFSHDLTPEKLLLLKEELIQRGLYRYGNG